MYNNIQALVFWLVIWLALLLLLLPSCGNAPPLEPAASAFASPPNRARPAATLSRSPQPLPLFTPANNQTPLEWARLLVQNVRPADTSYRHTGTQVTWAGWPIATGQPDSQTIAADYKSHTDCSGFINALLAQSFGLTTSDFQSWLKTGRPLAETYYSAISSHHGFIRLDNISQVKAGDIIAIRYPPGYGGDNTGHIMLLAGDPRPRSSSRPEVKGTSQWELPVIDSSETGHGPNDTRYKADGTFREGQGQGIFRLYSEETTGAITGYSWSNLPNSQYFDLVARPLVIGRLDAALILN